jgi:PKD repeat protein
MTITWDFGDGSRATGVSVTHQYAAVGTYTVTATANDSVNRSASTQTTAEVVSPTAIPALRDDEFSVYCGGPFCGATDATTFSGSGVGIWRYHNSSASSVTLNISINGVSAGQTAAIVFSNGQTTAAADVPDMGTLPAAVQIQSKLSNRSTTAGASAVPANGHTAMLERNRSFARHLLHSIRTRSPSPSAERKQLKLATRSAPPSIGTARQWLETYSTPVAYAMQVGAECSLVDGRNAIFWVDSAQLASGAISLQDAQDLATPFCGATGSYARLTSVVGAPYGTAASSYTQLLQDQPGSLQDINIVMPNVPQSTTWGGYFAAENLNLKSSDTNSNEALAVFVSGWGLAIYKDQGRTRGSILIHELKHLINFYQRALARGVYHSTFLEESSAMLAEDFVTPAVLGYSETDARFEGYEFSGGNSGYIGWTNPDGNSYNLGATFGGYLHRRYGLAVDRSLMQVCADHGDPLESYQCVDQIIKDNGGNGFEDDFARMGASVFGLTPRNGVPGGFGFPAKLVEGYVLDPIESAAYVNGTAPPYLPISPAKTLDNGFLATSHTYQVDIIASGQTTYKRSAVKVPGGTTMILIIRQPAPAP